jgi:hypothetical protein
LRRHLIGIVAIGFLVAGAVFWRWPISQGDLQLDASCTKTGLSLAVLWLAYPDLARLPAWLLTVVPAMIIVLAKWPRLFLFLIPLLIVLAILKPRWGQRRR